MKPFLYKIAESFYTRFENNLYKHTFIFPNRRAGIFFQKYLSEIAGKPLFSPNVITIQEFFEGLSQYKTADKIELLVLLYQQYSKIRGAEESFDDFLYWSEMLLGDFSDIDKYLVDSKQLFLNIHNLKSMDDDISYLTEDQVKAIRQFWENFKPYHDNDTKKEFLETWEVLEPLYNSFKETLHERGLAYEGMVFRDVAEKIKDHTIDTDSLENLVFVGLNAMTPTETKVLSILKDKGVADFYWDYESSLIKDPKNRASFWVKDNLSLFPSKYETENSIPDNIKTEIELIGVPSGVGQAKTAYQLLNKLIEEKSISKHNDGLNTAVILPDEQLLLPVLYSIPHEIDKINVTMGYSLQNSSAASLISAIASLQNNVRESEGKMSVYYKFVLAILNHPLTALVEKDSSAQLKNYIITNNRILLTEEELHTNSFFKTIFTIIKDWRDASEYLKQILSTLYQCLTSHKKENEEESHNTRATDLEREFITQYYKSITRLQESLSEVADMTVETYFRLLKQLSLSISVNFSGEPLSGLQVMGILETRTIDFENLIILSMNEGVFPLKKPTNSFVPYTLRKAFDMPTYEHQDSTYAYHFYRMISRAKRVYMLYDTRTEEMQSGEVSRYYYQLKYLYSDLFNIRERVVQYDVSSRDTKPISVIKDEAIMQKLEKFKPGGDGSFSASNINNYINCPLQFYFSAVEGLSEEEEVTESVESNIFGTIFHASIQNIYDRYKGKTVLPDTLNELIKNDKLLTEIIEKQFSIHQFKEKDKTRKLTGYYYLVGEVMRDLVKQTLRYDKTHAPFLYIDSEHRFKTHYHVSPELTVNVKGSIDRIDQTENSTRIIDYKSGKGELSFKSVEQLFDSSKNKRPYQILQVMFYSLFYNNEDSNISPEIYYLRTIFDENYKTNITYDKHPVSDASILQPEFKEHLNKVIEEIFDSKVPFSQTSNENNCTWCAFKEVCGRKGGSW